MNGSNRETEVVNSFGIGTLNGNLQNCVFVAVSDSSVCVIFACYLIIFTVDRYFVDLSVGRTGSDMT